MDNNVAFDFQAMLDMAVYASAPKELKPLLDVLNKYGIIGVRALSFISELGVACEEVNRLRGGSGDG